MSKRRTNPNWRERDKNKTFMPPKILKPVKKMRMFKQYLKLQQQKAANESQGAT